MAETSADLQSESGKKIANLDSKSSPVMMSHHQHASRGSGIPLKAPPPPTMKDLHPPRGNSRHGHFRRTRSRSMSPGNRRRQAPPPPRTRYSDVRSGGYDGSRERRRSTRRSRSRSPHGRSSSVVKEEPTSSSSYPTYVASSEDSHHRLPPSHLQQINRIPPLDPNDNTIVRTILNAENVKIPRRENEGIRPIFDREELREAIKRRIESGDNEQNPAIQEQRVVAIIREPLPMAPQFQEIIPILPTQYMPEQMMQQPPQARFETSTGVTYTYAKERSRSRSAPRQESRAEKERESGRVASRKRGDRRLEHEPVEGFPGRRRGGPPGRRSTRSRSSSPVARVDRVRSVRSFTLNSRSNSPELNVGRIAPWQDLRQCLNVHRNDRIQLTRAIAAEGYRFPGSRGGGRASRGGPPARGIGLSIRRIRAGSIPKRGPWKHDKFGREDEATEERSNSNRGGRHRAGRKD